MTIASDIQSLEPGKIVELFEMDPTALGGTTVYFHAGTNELNEPVVWQGITYQPFPIETSGFELSGRGTMPQPKMRVADVTSLITALCIELDDLLGAKITRRRTLVKYLDAVNFAGGVNATADPTQEFANEVWFINRKAEQRVGLYIDFELAAPFDLAGKMLPGRQCIANTCPWIYRGAECGYAGPAVADINDVATAVLGDDVCGKRLTSCKLRFGTFALLPYGGFPGAGLIR
jgi:lambda family phage minor tail protein L